MPCAVHPLYGAVMKLVAVASLPAERQRTWGGQHIEATYRATRSGKAWRDGAAAAHSVYRGDAVLAWAPHGDCCLGCLGMLPRRANAIHRWNDGVRRAEEELPTQLCNTTTNTNITNTATTQKPSLLWVLQLWDGAGGSCHQHEGRAGSQRLRSRNARLQPCETFFNVTDILWLPRRAIRVAGAWVCG